MHEVRVRRRWVVEVVDAQCAFHRVDTGLGGCDDSLLFVDVVVDVSLQRTRNAGELVVDLGGIGDPAADDERRSSLVDQNRIDLIDDAVVVASLHSGGGGHGHVVAQVVEAELVVGAVGDVGCVLLALEGRVSIAWDNQADAQAHPAVELTHVFGIAFGEVVVDRDDVKSFAAQAVQIDGQRRDERLALAGTHLGDPTQVQSEAAHELYVVVTHAECANRCFSHGCEHVDEKVVEGGAVLELSAEFTGFCLQRIVRERLHLGFKRVDVRNDRFEGAQFLALATA